MKTKVLIFISWFEPGYKAGGPITSNVNIVNHLAEVFDFYVITSSHDYHTDIPYENIPENEWVERKNAHVMYISPDNISFGSLKKATNEADCDVWYINGIYDPKFSIMPAILAKILKPKKVIISARGMLSPQAFGSKRIIKRILIKILKHTIYRGVVFHATNEIEKSFIQNQIGEKNLVVVAENLPRLFEKKSYKNNKQKGFIKLVSFARISSEKNTLFALKALRECKAKVYYDIYGQINGEEYWRECKHVINQLPTNVRVEYKGPVSPSQLSVLYQQYDMMYLPTLGENFGHAILESFMNGRPVIISDKTPWLNLESENVGWSLPLQENLFSTAIDKAAFMDAETYNVMMDDVQRYILSYFDGAGKASIERHVEMFKL